MSKNRTKTVTITFVLMLTITATLMTCLPATASTTPRPNTVTIAYLSLRPNLIGVGQELLINAWATPAPPLYTDLGYALPPGKSPMSGIPRTGNMFYFTDPDGIAHTVGPLTTTGEGALWFTFVPDKVGTWTVQFSWPGVEFIGEPGANVAYCSYLPCSTEKLPLVVQQDPIPSWPAAPLPTEPWDWPINPENREWANIAGPWSMLGYDAAESSYNPYTQAPASSHILWKLSTNMSAGLVGQPYGNIAAYGLSGYPQFKAILQGKGYYQTGGGIASIFGGGPPPTITCVDIRTGKKLWTVAGQFTYALVEAAPGAFGTTYQPVLFDIGERIVKYDALTGAVLVDDPGVPGYMMSIFGRVPVDYPYAYVKQHVGLNQTTGYYLVKLSLTGTAANIGQRVVWNVTMDSFNNKQYSFDYMIALYDDIIYNIEYPVFSDTGAFNATTGEILWHHPQDSPYAIEMGCGGASLGYGNAYFGAQDRQYVAYDLETGELVWASEKTAYPWGNFWAYESAVAYGMVYGYGYAGAYAFNATNGKIVWHYSTGDAGMETPYGTWPIHGAIGLHVVADGKVYVGTCEHSPSIFYRGQQLHCIDAYEGTKVWSIMGYYEVTAVAEGTLLATNDYDGCVYAFAKGETETTVAMSSEVIALGDSVLLKGSVLDMSPAQPGTPAVSKGSMSAWLEYLHMQQPMPTDTTGVPVHLYASHTNGTTYEIGTVKTDSQGYFRYKWTPTNEDVYAITASFNGDESYYSSWNTATLAVGAAPQAAPDYPQPIAPIDYTPIFAGIIVAIAVIAVLVVFDIVSVRKLRK